MGETRYNCRGVTGVNIPSRAVVRMGRGGVYSVFGRRVAGKKTEPRLGLGSVKRCMV